MWFLCSCVTTCTMVARPRINLTQRGLGVYYIAHLRVILLPSAEQVWLSPSLGLPITLQCAVPTPYAHLGCGHCISDTLHVNSDSRACADSRRAAG